MALMVKKFGGSSVANAERVFNVARIITDDYKKGNNVIVVVSAMGHTTDNLLKLSKEITSNPSTREMDMLLSTGEQISMSLLAMAINEAGHAAVSLTGYQVGIKTENCHMCARIVDIETARVKNLLSEGNIVIVAGFQGVCEGNEITTLGRGGSDTTAVALACAFGADRCDIYSDVEGVYTADPRVIKTAKKLDKISYEEMLELARVGANVLHPRAVETAKQFKVPLRVRSSFKLENKGTLIVGVEDMELHKPVTGVAADLTQLRIVVCDIPDTPGHAAKIFTKLCCRIGSKNLSNIDGF